MKSDGSVSRWPGPTSLRKAITTYNIISKPAAFEAFSESAWGGTWTHRWVVNRPATVHLWQAPSVTNSWLSILEDVPEDGGKLEEGAFAKWPRVSHTHA